MRFDPASLVPILGKTFVDELTQHNDRAPLRIGKDVWSRHEVAANLGIVQTRACSILSAVVKQIGATSTADLYRKTSPYTFAGYPVGVTTLYVMFAAFRDKGLDPDTWYRKNQDDAIISFISLKHRELVAERTTKAAERKRTRRERRREHESAVSKVLASVNTP